MNMKAKSRIKKKKIETELECGDMATTLTRIADRLRGHGLSLTGMAYQDHEPGQAEFRVLMEMAAGFEREAAILGMVGKMLCRRCKMAEVRELAVSTLASKNG